jgi:hypothetical protein
MSPSHIVHALCFFVTVAGLFGHPVESGRKDNKDGIQFLNIDGKLTDNHYMIVDSLNKYFLTIADNTSNGMNGHTTGFDPAKHYVSGFRKSIPKN